MLDRWSLKLIKRPAQQCAAFLSKQGITADQVTVLGFFIGMMAIPLIVTGHYGLALYVILLNRMADGIDGELARIHGSTDRGAFLDIVLDFIFYSAVIFAFAVADPINNALPAAALIFSFMGTGSSFLAFAIMAERRNLDSMHYPNKGFHYLHGITEGTETILFFVAMCLFPQYFVQLAWLFFGLCVLTTITRIISGAYTLSLPEIREN